MTPGVAVQYAFDAGSMRVNNDCARILFGVPGVHDDRSPRLGGKPDLRGEGVSLGLAGRVVVVVVETAFADGDSAPLEQLAQLRNVPARIKLCGVVGMDASCRENETRMFGRARGGDRRGID